MRQTSLIYYTAQSNSGNGHNGKPKKNSEAGWNVKKITMVVKKVMSQSLYITKKGFVGNRIFFKISENLDHITVVT